MGEYRYRLPDDWTLASRQASSIHIVGLDGVPWPCKVGTEGQTLVVRRLRDESGKTYIAYPFEVWGELVVCTGTLPEREEPYDFATEIARGTINRLRNQISIWEEGGLEIDPRISDQTSEAITCLGKAILSPDYKERDQLACRGLELAMNAIFELGDLFGEQISAFRCQHDEFATFWLATSFGDDLQGLDESNVKVQQIFELVEITPSTNNGQLLPDLPELIGQKKTIIGPLLDASAGGMSEALLEVQDFEARKKLILDRGRSVLSELPQSAAMLHVACGVNGLGHRHLSYPQQLQTVIDLLQMIEESSTEVPTLVSFDFPWAERMASSVGGIHPLQIADTLMRQGLNIGFLGLDINLDYWPGGSVVRDPLQWIDLIDVWSQLGLPLVICLRIPSEMGIAIAETIDFTAERRRLVNEVRSNLTDQQRMKLISTVLPMMVARPSVHGIIWRQWTDADDFRYPSAGLIGSESHAKTTAEVLAEFRETTLGR